MRKQWYVMTGSGLRVGDIYPELPDSFETKEAAVHARKSKNRHEKARRWSARRI